MRDVLDEGYTDVLLAGGGIAGLATALALGRAAPGLSLTLVEQALGFSEVGAGIQLGPNAVRVLDAWGLKPELEAVVSRPEALWVRDVARGDVLGRLMLGERSLQRYGQPYWTIHRCDLHRSLLQAVQLRTLTRLCLGQSLESVWSGPEGVGVQTDSGRHWQASVLLGCDGWRSPVRQQVWGDGEAHFSGHLAYRALVPMDDVPQRLRAERVSVWLGPGVHAVHYPVRAGRFMNLVLVLEGPLPPGGAGWDHAAHADTLRQALGRVHVDLMDLVQTVADWRLWPLFVREPMRSADEHARGRVALLGDAAHPMRPYLAQGAAMALEDAWALGERLAQYPEEAWAPRLQHWAAQRWPRNAWVQARARRNGTVFHARGLLRQGRNWSMSLLGEGLLDLPDLYGGPARPTTAAR